MKWLDPSTSKSDLHAMGTSSKSYELQYVTSVCPSIHRTVADVFDDGDDDNWIQSNVATMWPNYYVSPSLLIFIVIFLFFLENINVVKPMTE